MGQNERKQRRAEGALPRSGRRLTLAALALVLITVAAYSPVFSNGFVSWDDGDYLVNNIHLQGGLTGESWRWAFGARIFGNWHPLTWISHLLDVSLFGLNPTGHHAMSVALHAVSAVLLLVALRALTGLLVPSLVVAALFAVHPLHVESVAWASERKDVLSGLFWALSLLAYAAYARRPSVARYLLVAGSYAAGLLAKQMLVTLPFALLLLDWWPLGRFPGWRGPGAGGSVSPAAPPGRILLEKAPLFLLAVAAGWLTFTVQRAAQPLAANETIPLSGRIANAVHSYVAYAAQTAVPLNLSALYRHPESGMASGAFGAGVFFLAAATGIALTRAKREPFLAVGWFWYLATALPVIGIVQFSLQARADRYTYLPLTGLFLVVACGGASLAGVARARVALGVAAGVVLLLLSVLTFRQAEVWRSSESLFSNAVQRDPGNWQAWNYLGQAHWVGGRVQEAVEAYRQALHLRPDFSEARFNLSFALSQLGRTEEANALYRESSAAEPSLRADLYYQTGLVMFQQGDRTAAVVSLQEALRINPDFPEAAAALKKILAGGTP